jgi:hypothetical protein
MNGVAEMGSDRRSTTPAEPDLSNWDPFEGLPHDFPSAHSRFPLVPAPNYGDLSFDQPFDQNDAPQEIVMREDERKAWQDSMRQALGDLTDNPSVKDRA